MHLTEDSVFVDLIDQAQKADSAQVLLRLGEPLVEWKNGFLHRDFPHLWFENGVWRSFGGSLTDLQAGGNAIHFLMAFRHRSFYDAVETICRIVCPERMPQRTAQRHNPKEVFGRLDRQKALEALAEGGSAPLTEGNVPIQVPRRSAAPETYARAKDYLGSVFGIHEDLCGRVWMAGRMYVSRDVLVFPGKDPAGQSRFYYLLNF